MVIGLRVVHVARVTVFFSRIYILTTPRRLFVILAQDF